jgi:hypothetical protein
VKFKKEDLADGIGKYGDGPLKNTVLSEHTGSSRWAQEWRRVFEFQGKFYETYYRVASTECQDESPYEYDEDEIECAEVVARSKMITEYVIAEAVEHKP